MSCPFTDTRRTGGDGQEAYESGCSQLHIFISLLSSHSCFHLLALSWELLLASLRTALAFCLGPQLTLLGLRGIPHVFQSCNFSGFQAPYKIFNLLMAPFLGPEFFNNNSLLSVHEAFGGRENRHVCTDALLFRLLFLWCVISLKFSKCLLSNFLFAELTVSEGLEVCTYPCHTRGDTEVTVRIQTRLSDFKSIPAASLTFLGVSWVPLFHAISLPQTPSVSCIPVHICR